jgi:hypothetical protein
MIQDGFAIRETVDVIGHDKTSMHSLDMEAESHIIKAESCGSSAVNHLLVIITKPSRIAVRGGFSNAYFCIKSLMTSISFSKRVIEARIIIAISYPLITITCFPHRITGEHRVASLCPNSLYNTV